MSVSIPTKSSEEVRQELVDTIRLDLIGPDNDHTFANELLPEPPTRWYLTGFLVPTDAPIAQRFDETSPEEIDSPAEAAGLDDATDPDHQAASAANRRSLLPSSMGLSVLVTGEKQFSMPKFAGVTTDGKDPMMTRNPKLVRMNKQSKVKRVKPFQLHPL